MTDLTDLGQVLRRHGFRKSITETSWSRGPARGSRRFIAMITGHELRVDQIRDTNPISGSIDLEASTPDQVDAWLHGLLTS